MKKFSRSTAMMMAATMVLSGLSMPSSTVKAEEIPSAVESVSEAESLEDDALDVKHSALTQVTYQSVYDTTADNTNRYENISLLKDGDTAVNKVVTPLSENYPAGNPSTVSVENAPLKKTGTFIVYDGVLESVTDASKLTEENKAHFTTCNGLNGWDNDNNCPILYNVYEADGTYTIKYAAMGGGSLNVADAHVGFGKTNPNLPYDEAIPMDGYVFKNWQLENGEVVTDKTVFNSLSSKTITIYANFEKISNTITVNFYSDYSVPYTVNLDNCSTAEGRQELYNRIVADAQRAGYKFEKLVESGTNNTVTAEDFLYKKNMMLDAVYTPLISYHHVTYHVGDIITNQDVSNKAIVDIMVEDKDAAGSFEVMNTDLNTHTVFEGAGHSWVLVDKVSETVFRAICLGEENETGDDILSICDQNTLNVTNLETSPWTTKINGKEIVADSVTLVSQSSHSLRTVSQDGYEFMGWFLDEEFRSPLESLDDCEDADVDLYAKFSPVQYKVTLDVGEGTLPEGVADTYAYNIEDGFIDTQKDTMTLPVPTREHYEFDGWTGTDENSEAYKISSIFAKAGGKDYNLKAVWKPLQYRIVYNLAGGSVTGAPRYHSYGENVDLPNPTKLGYAFDGWFTDSEYQTELEDMSLVDGTVAVFAKWSPCTYQISYELNGGVGSDKNPQKYTIEDQPMIFNPTREGFSFAGWFTDKEMKNALTDADFVSAKDLTLYAKWQGCQYNLTCKFNGANAITEPSSFRVGIAPELTNPSREGYIFTGWYFDENCTKPAGQDSPEWSKSENVTVYAGWKACAYKITYQLNGGSVVQAPRFYSYKTPANVPDASRKGYHFGGWYLDSKCKTKVTNASYNTTGDKTFYAKWEKCSPGLSKIKKIKSRSKGKVSISLKKQNAVEGYQVRYATNKNFEGAKVKKAGTSVTLKNLTSGNVYFMQVRTYVKDSAGEKVYSKWSKTKTVKVK